MDSIPKAKAVNTATIALSFDIIIIFEKITVNLKTKHNYNCLTIVMVLYMTNLGPRHA